ncbi:MAG: hypothetical protein J6L83_05475 [Clostridia bacterium]|nr:hypothetical protein [Clostridia bacterium]
MFKLIYRDGAPENAGHYEVIDKAAGTALAVGRLVKVSGGVASAYDGSGDETLPPYGVVAINAAANEDEVTVLKITQDMIFRAEFVGSTVSPTLNVGGVYGISEGGVSPYGIFCFQITNVVDAITDIDNGDEYIKAATVEGRFVDVRSTVG